MGLVGIKEIKIIRFQVCDFELLISMFYVQIAS